MIEMDKRTALALPFMDQNQSEWAKTINNTKKDTITLIEAQSTPLLILLSYVHRDTSHGFGVLFMFYKCHINLPKIIQLLERSRSLTSSFLTLITHFFNFHA